MGEGGKMEKDIWSGPYGAKYTLLFAMSIKKKIVIFGGESTPHHWPKAIFVPEVCAITPERYFWVGAN